MPLRPRPAVRARALFAQLAAFALKTSGVTLELGQAGHGNQIFLPKIADAFQFLIDELNFATFCCGLAVIPGDLLAKLSDALAKLGSLAISRLSAQFEQPFLSRDRSCCIDLGRFTRVDARA